VPKDPKLQAATAVNDLETQYWAALESQGSHRSQVIATHANATAQASLCEVCYSHIDQVAPPEELSNAQGRVIGQAAALVCCSVLIKCACKKTRATLAARSFGREF